MATSPQRLTIYLYSAHRAVIFAIAQVSCFISQSFSDLCTGTRLTNEMNILNSSHLAIKFPQPANLTIYKIWPLVQSTWHPLLFCWPKKSLSVLPYTSSRFTPSCRYHHITVPQSLYSLSPFITPSTFYYRLKTDLFHNPSLYSLPGSFLTAFTDLEPVPD